MARAKISLPVPDSPEMKTVASHRANLGTRWSSCKNAALSPMTCLRPICSLRFSISTLSSGGCRSGLAASAPISPAPCLRLGCWGLLTYLNPSCVGRHAPKPRFLTGLLTDPLCDDSARRNSSRLKYDKLGAPRLVGKFLLLNSIRILPLYGRAGSDTMVSLL